MYLYIYIYIYIYTIYTPIYASNHYPVTIYHIISCHIMSGNIISYHTTTCHTTSYHAISHHIIWYYDVSHCLTLHSVTLHYIILYHLVLYHGKLYCVMLSYSNVMCYLAIQYITLWYLTLVYTILWYSILVLVWYVTCCSAPLPYVKSYDAHVKSCCIILYYVVIYDDFISYDILLHCIALHFITTQYAISCCNMLYQTRWDEIRLDSAGLYFAYTHLYVCIYIYIYHATCKGCSTWWECNCAGFLVGSRLRSCVRPIQEISSMPFLRHSNPSWTLGLSGCLCSPWQHRLSSNRQCFSRLLCGHGHGRWCQRL